MSAPVTNRPNQQPQKTSTQGSQANRPEAEKAQETKQAEAPQRLGTSTAPSEAAPAATDPSAPPAEREAVSADAQQLRRDRARASEQLARLHFTQAPASGNAAPAVRSGLASPGQAPASTTTPAATTPPAAALPSTPATAMATASRRMAALPEQTFADLRSRDATTQQRALSTIQGRLEQGDRTTADRLMRFYQSSTDTTGMSREAERNLMGRLDGMLGGQAAAGNQAVIDSMAAGLPDAGARGTARLTENLARGRDYLQPNHWQALAQGAVKENFNLSDRRVDGAPGATAALLDGMRQGRPGALDAVRGQLENNPFPVMRAEAARLLGEVPERIGPREEQALRSAATSGAEGNAAGGRFSQQDGMLASTAERSLAALEQHRSNHQSSEQVQAQLRTDAAAIRRGDPEALARASSVLGRANLGNTPAAADASRLLSEAAANGQAEAVTRSLLDAQRTGQDGGRLLETLGQSAAHLPRDSALLGEARTALRAGASAADNTSAARGIRALGDRATGEDVAALTRNLTPEAETTIREALPRLNASERQQVAAGLRGNLSSTTAPAATAPASTTTAPGASATEHRPIPEQTIADMTSPVASRRQAALRTMREQAAAGNPHALRELGNVLTQSERQMGTGLRGDAQREYLNGVMDAFEAGQPHFGQREYQALGQGLGAIRAADERSAQSLGMIDIPARAGAMLGRGVDQGNPHASAALAEQARRGGLQVSDEVANVLRPRLDRLSAQDMGTFAQATLNNGLRGENGDALRQAVADNRPGAQDAVRNTFLDPNQYAHVRRDAASLLQAHPDRLSAADRADLQTFAQNPRARLSQGPGLPSSTGGPPADRTESPDAAQSRALGLLGELGGNLGVDDVRALGRTEWSGQDALNRELRDPRPLSDPNYNARLAGLREGRAAHDAQVEAPLRNALTQSTDRTVQDEAARQLVNRPFEQLSGSTREALVNHAARTQDPELYARIRQALPHETIQERPDMVSRLPMNQERAREILRDPNNYRTLDNLARGGRRDGALGRNDLEAAAGRLDVPPDVRAAARFLSQPAEFNRLAGSDGLIQRGEVLPPGRPDDPMIQARESFSYGPDGGRISARHEIMRDGRERTTTRFPDGSRSELETRDTPTESSTHSARYNAAGNQTFGVYESTRSIPTEMDVEGLGLLHDIRGTNSPQGMLNELGTHGTVHAEQTTRRYTAGPRQGTETEHRWYVEGRDGQPARELTRSQISQGQNQSAPRWTARVRSPNGAPGTDAWDSQTFVQGSTDNILQRHTRDGAWHVQTTTADMRQLAQQARDAGQTPPPASSSSEVRTREGASAADLQAALRERGLGDMASRQAVQGFLTAAGDRPLSIAINEQREGDRVTRSIVAETADGTRLVVNQGPEGSAAQTRFADDPNRARATLVGQGGEVRDLEMTLDPNSGRVQARLFDGRSWQPSDTLSQQLTEGRNVASLLQGLSDVRGYRGPLALVDMAASLGQNTARGLQPHFEPGGRLGHIADDLAGVPRGSIGPQVARGLERSEAALAAARTRLDRVNRALGAQMPRLDGALGALGGAMAINDAAVMARALSNGDLEGAGRAAMLLGLDGGTGMMGVGAYLTSRGSTSVALSRAINVGRVAGFAGSVASVGFGVYDLYRGDTIGGAINIAQGVGYGMAIAAATWEIGGGLGPIGWAVATGATVAGLVYDGYNHTTATRLADADRRLGW